MINYFISTALNLRHGNNVWVVVTSLQSDDFNMISVAIVIIVIAMTNEIYMINPGE